MTRPMPRVPESMRLTAHALDVDLAKVTGTGPGGTITGKDILAVALGGSTHSPSSGAARPGSLPPYGPCA